MAEMHLITPSINPEGARRLGASLSELFEQGIDTGPRGPQIRSLGLSLETLAEALRRELARIGVSESLNEGLANIERLAALARAYPDPDVCAAPDTEGAPVR